MPPNHSRIVSLTDDLTFNHVHHHGQSLQNLKPKSTLSAVICSWSWYRSNRNVSNTNARELLLSQLDMLLAENQSRNKWLSTHHGSNNICSQYKVTLFQSPHKYPMCCSVQTQFQPVWTSTEAQVCRKFSESLKMLSTGFSQVLHSQLRQALSVVTVFYRLL